ncbi:hypothetical protein [Olivibacter domesticus]|uniref:Uncharacterized protein n=1 Tax=Olivibacter domesticus TaxID=407022 RepID=A0A1H7J9R2_OLID1|nr:hypothetical protein [Olivibacter domesticus]SEK71022.1 hypothetical protein SAMN05661044_00949 [Olivibacter domesticus]
MKDQQVLFENQALWIHDFEIQNMNYDERFSIRHFSFVPPLSKHSGNILLTEAEIILYGDEATNISLRNITELYYGFDELYTASSVKNFGIFWKPLRIKYNLYNVIYLIVNYRHFYTSNEQFLSILKDMLL